MRHLGSPAGAFWIFTCVDWLSLIFGLTLMPETRGKTLEAIAAGFQKAAGTRPR